MMPADLQNIFTEDILNDLLPPHLADAFFEALFGEAEEGAYDISLSFKKFDPERNVLSFELLLKERPGKCLSCNLTYGLPEVFSRHPLINIQGVVAKIATLLGEGKKCLRWELGHTRTPAADMHTIPLTIWLA